MEFVRTTNSLSNIYRKLITTNFEQFKDVFIECRVFTLRFVYKLMDYQLIIYVFKYKNTDNYTILVE